eukprot:gene7561-10302_t
MVKDGAHSNFGQTQVASTSVERALSVNSSNNKRKSDHPSDCIPTENYISDSENSSGCTDLSSKSYDDADHHSDLGSLDQEHLVTFSILDNVSQVVGKIVHNGNKFGSNAGFIHKIIQTGLESESFLVTNLNCIIAQLKQWRCELPMVEPFYAVKCNPDPVIIRLLASLGCNFDCATMGEIDLVLNGIGQFNFGARGVAASSIVYANPAKMPKMLQFAIDNNVRMTVFDGEDELRKIAGLDGHENLQLLLRLTTDDKSSVCRFSKKFGCPVSEAPQLLAVAKSLNLNVAGVSFHVGSGCGDSEAYATALEHARLVFLEAERLGMKPLSIVDIGGGFPGDSGGYGGPGMPSFQDLAATIRLSIESFIKALGRTADTFRFIAEPGRYFVSSSTTIVTKVYSRKGGNNNYQALYVDDGVYGSFNNVVYDHASPIPARLASILSNSDEEVIPTAVFGPTCDGLDQMCSLETTTLPRCDIGDWLIWENQGAYTHTASFVFNGYTHVPNKTYCML